MTKLEPLSKPSLARVVGDWDALIGAGGAFAGEVPAVVQRPTDPGTGEATETATREGWVACVRIGERLVVSVPSHVDAAPLQDAVAALSGNDDEPAALVKLFSAVEVLGPARLKFRDRVPAHVGHAEVLWSDDARHRDDFRSVCSESDLGESGLPEPGQAAAVVLVGGRAVASSWWDPWHESLAHVAVLVAPDWRGRGLAADVAAVATKDAIRHGRVAQWRVRPAIAASVATARRLGFVDLGYQLTLRQHDR